jgi:serine/threonine-protein kinase
MTTAACGTCGAPTDDSSAGGLCAVCLFAVALSDAPTGSRTGEDALDDLPAGTRVAQFVVRRPLGRGGMGVVYEAQDTDLDRAVALKVLPARFLHDQTFARRFAAEARVVASLEHPNIVPIYGAGIDSGVAWMSMRLFAGDTLSVLLERQRLAPLETVRLLRHVAAALDYAHGRGVIHRDIKPANILLDQHGIACVADFGLARMTDAGTSLTQTGMVTGTPHYMAPEQALGRPVDHRCDIYSLGIVAYEMLTGSRPFTGPSPLSVLMQHVHQPLPDAPEGPSARRWMDAIRKAAAKDRAERWSSAGAFVDALEAGLDSVAIDAGATAPALQRPGFRSRRVRAAVGAGALAAIAGLAWAVVHQSRTPPPADPPVLATAPASRGAPPASRAEVAPNGQDAPNAQSSPSARAAETRGTERRPSAAGAVEPSPSPSSVPVPVETPGNPSSGAATARVETPLVVEPLTRPPGVATPPPQPAEVFTVPVVIRRVDPVYPQVAVAAELKGDVVLEGLVDVDGKVRDITVVRSAHRSLEGAARKAWSQYLYKPALRNGTPEPQRVRAVITFRFKPE